MGVVRIAFVEVFKIGDAVVARIAAERTDLQVPEIVRAYEGAELFSNDFGTDRHGVHQPLSSFARRSV